MKEEAFLEIKTEQIDLNGNKDLVEFKTKVEVLRKKNYIYIKYEGSEVLNTKGTTNLIKVEDNIVTMKKMGKNSTTMIFEKNKRYKTIYGTELGFLPMEILPEVVDINIDSDLKKTLIKIEYNICITGIFEGKNIITMRFL
ncbi:MAG: DUF1934 domain-containing protein [Peptostreptococcaceae bacterium]|jgi:uncharacterized beta-barrel protein YwiB (DUF1934 family)|nr:DUF1934 domain-containing protein [Peptostreptococcaceae bacterium]